MSGLGLEYVLAKDCKSPRLVSYYSTLVTHFGPSLPLADIGGAVPLASCMPLGTKDVPAERDA